MRQQRAFTRPKSETPGDVVNIRSAWQQEPIARPRQTASGLLKHIGLLIAFFDFLKK
jgi:hypothetical protein